MKEFEINMVICNENDDLTEDILIDKFHEFVDSLKCYCGGGIKELTQEDYDKIDKEDADRNKIQLPSNEEGSRS